MPPLLKEQNNSVQLHIKLICNIKVTRDGLITLSAAFLLVVSIHAVSRGGGSISLRILKHVAFKKKQ